MTTESTFTYDLVESDRRVVELSINDNLAKVCTESFDDAVDVVMLLED